MKLKEIKNSLVNEKYFFTQHDSGLKIFVYPKKDNNSTYVLLGTKYGSINTEFTISNNGEKIQVPAGTAHFLEHKMFENENSDAFSEYAKTGANANAYTSFDKTCYLFSCTEKLEESLDILLTFVTTPYFTDETVKKEQGIIEQEIKMYQDNPDWSVLFNLLCAMYHNCSVKIDIAGTVESIAQITPQKLMECHNAFYNLNNMALCITGNVDPEKIIEFLEKKLTTSNKVTPWTFFKEEPYEVVSTYVEKKFPISLPMFNLGFKEDCQIGATKSANQLAQTDVLLEMIASKSSRLYQDLLDNSLINEKSFSYEYFSGPGYSAIIFSGETSDPEKVAKLIKDYLETLRKNGLDKKSFERAKKSVYGKGISLFNSQDTISNTLIDLEFSGNSLFEYIDCLANVTFQGVTERFSQQLDTKNCSLSVVVPGNEE